MEDTGSSNQEDGARCHPLKYTILKKHNQHFFARIYKPTFPWRFSGPGTHNHIGGGHRQEEKVKKAN